MAQSLNLLTKCTLTLGLALAVPLAGAQAQSFTILHQFQNSGDQSPARNHYTSDGITLIADSSGNLYGTTRNDASRSDPNNGGTILKFAPDGTETVLYTFCSKANCTDGALPEGKLLLDAAGNLYGTTEKGGAHNSGTLFKLAPNGTETVLHSFNTADGKYPRGGLAVNSSGGLLGTTSSGGAYGFGNVFILTPTGKFLIVHDFAGGPNDGANPASGVIVYKNYLYGVTLSGGSGGGTVFKIGLGGASWRQETILHAFDSATEYGIPLNIVADKKGNLYGTTANDYGTTPGGFGAFYRLAPNGTLTEVPTANYPTAVNADANGNIYFAQVDVGGREFITKFTPVTPALPNLADHQVVDYAFPSLRDGSGAWDPVGGLVSYNGSLYGTTSYGPVTAAAGGVLFKFHE